MKGTDFNPNTHPLPSILVFKNSFSFSKNIWGHVLITRLESAITNNLVCLDQNKSHRGSHPA